MTAQEAYNKSLEGGEQGRLYKNLMELISKRCARGHFDILVELGQDNPDSKYLEHLRNRLQADGYQAQLEVIEDSTRLKASWEVSNG